VLGKRNKKNNLKKNPVISAVRGCEKTRFMACPHLTIDVPNPGGQKNGRITESA
jgi:hypothetical protein